MMPFPGGIEALANGTLVFSAAAALLYLLIRDRAPSWRRTVVKAAAVALLALLAAMEDGPVLLMAALALSAAGDAFLAHEGERPFLGGLASFLFAHLAYVALFATAGGGAEILLAQPWRAALPLLAAAASVVLLFRLLPAVGPALRLPVAAYVAAIVAMVVTAATVPAPVVMLGAVLFLASDAILAIEKFLLAPDSRHRVWAGPAVWVLYYLAQLAITLGFLL